jgi:hypothetical protein
LSRYRPCALARSFISCRTSSLVFDVFIVVACR